MSELRRILCPVDFSEFSRYALEHALALARRGGGRVTALHVHPAPAGAEAGPEGLDAAGLVRLHRELRQFVERVAGSDINTADVGVGEGHAASEILREAAVLPADAIVLGTHGVTGFEPQVLGSVTERVLRKARCPVVTVPRRGPGRVRFGTILCAVDFSEASLAALDCALALGHREGGRVVVVHVLEAGTGGKAGAAAGAESAGGAALRESEARVREALPRAECAVEPVVACGRAYSEILRLVEDHRADLVVTGASGDDASEHGLLGSTAHHLVLGAGCPVATVRRRS